MTVPLWRVMLQASDEALKSATTLEEEDRAISAAHLLVIVYRLFPSGQAPPPWFKGEHRIWKELQKEINRCQSVDNTQQTKHVSPIHATIIEQRRSTMPR